MGALLIALTGTPSLVFAQTSGTEVAVSASEQRTELSKLERTRSLMKDAENEHQQKGSAPTQDASGIGLKMFQGLAFALGLLFIGLYFVKKLNPRAVGGAERKIKIVERTPVTPKTSLILAEVEGKKVFLAVGPDRVSFHSLDSESGINFGESLESICRDETKHSA